MEESESSTICLLLRCILQLLLPNDTVSEKRLLLTGIDVLATKFAESRRTTHGVDKLSIIDCLRDQKEKPMFCDVW